MRRRRRSTLRDQIRARSRVERAPRNDQHAAGAQREQQDVAIGSDPSTKAREIHVQATTGPVVRVTR